MTKDDNDEFIDSSIKTCKYCAVKLSNELQMSEIQDEYILSEEKLI